MFVIRRGTDPQDTTIENANMVATATMADMNVTVIGTEIGIGIETAIGIGRIDRVEEEGRAGRAKPSVGTLFFFSFHCSVLRSVSFLPLIFSLFLFPSVYGTQTGSRAPANCVRVKARTYARMNMNYG